MKEVTSTAGLCCGISQMLEVIREQHIDIVSIIEEELDELIPMIIEDIVNSIYESRGLEVVQ